MSAPIRFQAAAAAEWACTRTDAGPQADPGDEPVASLDPVLAHSILKYLEKLNKEQGITVICSLHFLDLVHPIRHARHRPEGWRDRLPRPSEGDRRRPVQGDLGQEAERVSII